MDKESAKKLIQETLEKPFQKDRFVQFVGNLLNHVEDAPFTYLPARNVIKAFEGYIQKVERVCKYKGSQGKKIDVLIVYLKKGTSLERARTMQRNYIARYLKESRGWQFKDAALVAFVSPNPEDWRFSLVKMEYSLDTTGEKVKAKEELTPARRYSYLVGQNENSHTAQSRLIPLVMEDDHDPALTDLEEAFNIEKVTKEFFEQYRELFLKVKDALDQQVEANLKIKEDFEVKAVDTVDFSKKLLGQIVFLYFLQKKGWFGVERDADWGTGPKNFLRKLFNKDIGSYSNFFNDILEPMFYEALAWERTNDYYSKLNCKIPFLNGGLFDPINNYDWVHTDILLPNELFSNSIKTSKGDIGTGILDVFDRYNFTVKEDEPLEKEVAVDPEMLGKVFENLLEVKDRKSKGTYYTPREIVHYMCQESLIHYLETEINVDPAPMVPEKPSQEKLFGKADPEQTSFKVMDNLREDLEKLIHFGEAVLEHDSTVVREGKETDTYSFKLPESIRKNAQALDDALAKIRICDPAVGSGAFLVGMMSEIVRIRKSLTTYLNDEKERTSYDFKRQAVHDCLYGVDNDPGAVEICKLRLWLSLVVDEDDIEQIQPLPNLDYKIITGDSLLGIKRNLYNLSLFNELEELKVKYFDETSVTKKQNFKEKIDSLIYKIFKGKKVFDFEVYFSEVFHEKKGFDVVIANPPYGAKFSSEQRTSLLRAYKHQNNTPESYLLFIEKGHSLCRRGGVLSYIVPNSWLPSLTFQKFRRFLTSQFQWRSLLVVKTKVFEAVVDTNVLIFEVQPPANGALIPIFFFGPTGLFLAHRLPWDEIPKNGDPINIVFPPEHQKLFNKIKQNGVLFKDVVNVFNGVKPFEKGKGNPPQSAQIMRDKPFVVKGSKPTGTNWMPLLRGSLINRYVTLWNNDSWIKYGKWLAAPRDPAIFEEPVKIFVRQTGDSIIATLGKANFVGRNNLHIILPKGTTNLLFVLGILNSKLMNFAYCFINPEKGEALAEVKKKHIEELPLPKSAIEESQRQKTIIALVDRILVAKQSDAKSDTSLLEKEIDQLVFSLYDLTPEEIQTMENHFKG